MRISDWSSDVCSSDLTGNALQLRQLDSGVTRVLDAQAGAVYRNLSWSKDGHALAALREVEVGEDEPADLALLAFIGMDAGAPQRRQFLDRKSTRLNSSH